MSKPATRIACAGVLAACAFLSGGIMLAQATWIHAKAIVAQQMLQQSWRQGLQDHVHARPWSWADVEPVAEITVPRLHISQVVLDTDAGAALAFAPGHMQSTVRPGEAGASVLVAHRDTHFGFLRALQAGDAVYVVRRDGQEVRYRVSASGVIDTRQGEVRIASEAPVLLLVTCYPFDAVTTGTPYRYVVTAEAVTTRL